MIMFKKTDFVLVFCATAICHCANILTEADNTTLENLNLSTVDTSTAKPENASCEQYNGQCGECVKHKSCYYCQSNEKCSWYVAKPIFPTGECSVNNIRYLTCGISLMVLIILTSTLAGIVFLVILCVCCYCCCKKKGMKLSKDEIKFARQREERKARAEERKKERTSRTDEIRRKYGLMKDDNPYERFDEK